MGRVSSLITQKVNTMSEAGDLDKLRSKQKPLVALLPYAVWQERHGQPEMFDMLLRTARAPGTLMFAWHCIQPFALKLFSKATPRVIIFISSSINWDRHSPIADQGDFVQRWAAATSVVQYTEEAAQSVVDMLLKIVYLSELSVCTQHITPGVWSWLTRRPTLPPICQGRRFGTSSWVISIVRRLENIETLKSYLLLIWSEWSDPPHEGFEEMRASVREDFCGIGMGHHRGDLVRRLDHVLGQLVLSRRSSILVYCHTALHLP